MDGEKRIQRQATTTTTNGWMQQMERRGDVWGGVVLMGSSLSSFSRIASIVTSPATDELLFGL